MSLKKQPEFQAETPAFEAEGQAATTTQTTITANEEAMNTTTNAKSATATANAAIASASANAVTTPSKKFSAAFADVKDVFDAATVSALSRATPRVTAEQGSMYLNRKDKLGDVIRVELVSWNRRWAIGTGVDNAEAKDLFRVSYDGVTLDGQDVKVSDYVESLKAMGYDKARASEYGDMFAYITYTKEKGDIAADDRELVLVQMSPTSFGAFQAFCVSRGLLESKGMAKPCEFLEIHAEAKESKGNRYTNMSFRAVK